MTLNQRLGAVALALGALAIFAHPQRGPVYRIDAREMALIVEKEVDHVKPAELAAWIVEGRGDYRLLDLRSAAEYAAYHIPTAESVPLSALTDYPLLRNEKLVIYSEGGIHAAQAWFLMRARGYEAVYTLLGGLDGWKDEVLYPTLAADAGPQQRAQFERAAALARFFGGKPMLASTSSPAESVEFPAAAAAPPPPTTAPPVAGSKAPPTAPRKKKKEGC